MSLIPDESLADVERAQVSARLADMRRVIGEEAAAGFIEKARDELHGLAEQPGPWSAATIDRALASSMFLGLATLEAACRALPAPRDPDRQEQARRAARSALRFLDDTSAG